HLVIGLSGKPRSGKDTVAKMLKEQFPDIQLVTIGNAVKEEYDSLHGTNTLHSEEEKLRHREGINVLGSERRAEDLDYWVKRTIHTHQPPMLITDVRWPHEADVVHKAKGFLIRIEADRETLHSRMGEDFHGHLNKDYESLLDDYKKWDFVIENNGTLDDLKTRVHKVREAITRQLEERYG
ncbi:hypothetical protein KGQ71_04755, partial [Patescibacteria group bacterium]|nr:hypothetical protein [Patescibacteria group bacterium]